MPRKVFVSGEILTASDVNTQLMDQSVMVFDDATARTTAIPTPVEGMVTYLKDDDEVTVFDGSAFKAVGPGKILQVVSSSRITGFSVSTSSQTNVPDLAVTLTPSSSNSKVFLLVNLMARAPAPNVGIFDVTATSGASPTTTIRLESIDDIDTTVALSLLHAPATTSAVTYQVRASATAGATTVSVNSTLSTITAMEVAG